ncbi:hypothetical protein [Roseivirga pacifica]|uniref:hypothetical protein n=1 Tax=Roseivirga pacifica TaxID=1267423 RepID=UPI003BA93935
MEDKRVQFVFSLIFLIAYLALIFIVLFLETQSSFEIKPNHDSMLGELKILIGVLTAGVAQILNFWFGNSKKAQKEEVSEEEQP